MSRSPRPFVFLGFSSVHETLEAQDALQAAGVPTTPVPSPRQLGELCGIALRLEPSDEPAAVRVLAASGRPPKARAEIEDL